MRELAHSWSECGEFSCVKKLNLCNQWKYGFHFEVKVRADIDFTAISTHPTAESDFENCSLEACEG